MPSSAVPVPSPFCEDAAVGQATAVRHRARLGLVGQIVMQPVWGCLVTGLLGWEVFGSCLASFRSKYPLRSVSSYTFCAQLNEALLSRS